MEIFELVKNVSNSLKEKNLKITFAESCTGGLLAKLLTDVPGASQIFEGSLCSYSNKIKSQLLGVKEKTLLNYGAVSAETAAEMALGIRKLICSDIGISCTGVAGPEKEENKNVGLVFVGFSSDKKSFTKRLDIIPSCDNYLQTRLDIRLETAKFIFNELKNF